MSIWIGAYNLPPFLSPGVKAAHTNVRKKQQPIPAYNLLTDIATQRIQKN